MLTPEARNTPPTDRRASRFMSRLAGASLAALAAVSCSDQPAVYPPLPEPTQPPAAEAPPVTPPGPLYPSGSACHSRQMDGPAIVEAIKPAVVRVQTDLGSGTGFMIASPRSDDLLIATNHHVVAEGHKFSAFVSTGAGQAAEIAGLEIVKMDTKNDLVLLRAPRLPGLPKGLYLNADGVKIGQTIVAVGYPALTGATKFELSFGKGDVSAATIELNDRKFVQADLPLNPGNSGGPVVDSCGAVIGIVVATLKKVERVQLVVPVAALISLYDGYVAPRPPPEAGVRARLGAFEKAIKWRQGDEAAAFFTESFLESVVVSDLTRTLRKFESHMDEYDAALAQQGIGPDAPLALRLAAMEKLVPPDELDALMTFILLKKGVIGEHEALKSYLSTWISDVFGDFQSLQIDEVTNATETSATARITITNRRGPSLWQLQMVYKAGDYQIDSLKCVRGC